jgi:hypothetical protein
MDVVVATTLVSSIKVFYPQKLEYHEIFFLPHQIQDNKAWLHRI